RPALVARRLRRAQGVGGAAARARIAAAARCVCDPERAIARTQRHHGHRGGARLERRAAPRRWLTNRRTARGREPRTGGHLPGAPPVKAVARLMVVSSTGTVWMRPMPALGLPALVGGPAILASLPPLVAQHGGPAQFSLGVETMLSLLP